ncbi:MAG: SpoIIE family protein phosphatase [Bacteroidota bacterium]
MLDKSIAYRLSIYISLAVISVFIVFIAIYFLSNQKTIKENVYHKAVAASANVVGNVRYHVVSTKEIANNISEQIIFYGQHEEADLFIERLIEKYPFINAIHVNIDTSVPQLPYHNFYCFNYGDSIRCFHNNTKFKTCISEEIPFKRLQENQEPNWSEPIRCNRNNNVVAPYYSPITITGDEQKDKHVGEVICELSLFELNESINSIEIGERGFAFLLSKEGTYVTHPNKEWILKRSIFKVSKKIYNPNKIDVESILQKGLTGTTIAYPEYLDYEKCWVYYTPIEDCNWTLIYVMPFDKIYGPLYLSILRMLFFSVLGILVIFMLVTYISNRQIQPLSSVTNQLKNFSSLTGDSDATSMNEVKRISESLNNLKSWYEKYKLSLSNEVKKSKDRQRDLLQASEIQRSFIQTDFPAFTNRDDIDLFAIYKPVHIVSGDLYDYFFIDDDNLVFTIGDVSGKGVPAAFFMSVAQTIIKSSANKKSAKSIVNKANKNLYTNNQHQFFLTMFLGILNLRTGNLTYCNAAHTPPYILRKNGELQMLSQAHGLPLGLYPDKKYKEDTIDLTSGDSIILYTDGVTELFDENKLQYGNSRFEENIKNLTELPPKEMAERIEKSLNLFVGESKQSDDISLLIIKYKA